ncbi:50S ribosomal protein L6 [Lachnospiraceae bacterium]|nr:50S ribosomal protein L6 [Lachnospiraceae bacterium]
MSRIGRMPIAIPAGVTVDIAENNKVTVKGPKGTLERVLPSEMEIKMEGEQITVSRPNDLKKMKSLHGLTRTLINNMVIGVTQGYEKKLEVNGVGYRAAKAGKKLTLSLGYSHPVEMEDPEGIETVVEGQNVIIVKGISKEKVGNSTDLFSLRSPIDITVFLCLGFAPIGDFTNVIFNVLPSTSIFSFPYLFEELHQAALFMQQMHSCLFAHASAAIMP